MADVVCEFSESVLDDGVGEEGRLSTLGDDPFWWDIKPSTSGTKVRTKKQEKASRGMLTVCASTGILELLQATPDLLGRSSFASRSKYIV
jgi:hypothetical protein